MQVSPLLEVLLGVDLIAKGLQRDLAPRHNSFHWWGVGVSFAPCVFIVFDFIDQDRVAPIGPSLAQRFSATPWPVRPPARNAVHAPRNRVHVLRKDWSPESGKTDSGHLCGVELG